MTFGWPNTRGKKHVSTLKTVWKHVATQGDRRGRKHIEAAFAVHHQPITCFFMPNLTLPFFFSFFFFSLFPQEHLGLCIFSRVGSAGETSASPEALAPRLTKRENASRLFSHCAAGGAATRFSHQACPMKSEPGLHFTRTAVQAIRSLFTFTP